MFNKAINKGFASLLEIIPKPLENFAYR